MAALRASCVILLLTAALAAQTPPAQRYRIVSGNSHLRFLDAVNSAATKHYRALLVAGASMLMEHAEDPESYKYVLVEDGALNQLRENLNLSGARGYRVIGAVGHGLFPTPLLLMEKAPGRPNQFQYVLENGHHISMGKFLPHDEFSSAPPLIAGRIRDGYLIVAQVGMVTILEKSAEPNGDRAACMEPSCYDLRVLDTRKHFADSLTESGRSGLHFTSATHWVGMSTTAVLTLLVRGNVAPAYEYRTVPSRHDKIGGPLEAAAADGFCATARVRDVILMERSADGSRCKYRVLYGAADAVERDLEKAAANGYIPVLLSPEIHAGFSKVTVNYTVLAENAMEKP